MRNTYKNILNFFNNNEAQFRLEVIKLFEEFGLKPTQKAFGVSKATLYHNPSSGWAKRKSFRRQRVRYSPLFIYPRCPKINSFVERANRTLKEEFLNEYQDLALTDINLLNQELIKYLVWYNTQRPHEALNYKSPIDF